MPSIISIKNLSKTYASGFQALKDINLDIRRGEIFALLGPNGAGKTTLISIICGIVNPTAGTVTVDGHDIVDDYRAARSLIGLVPQELHHRRLRDACGRRSASAAACSASRPIPAHIEKVLKDLSLWDKKDSKIMTLSGGMKRRVLIAKALSHEPQILFLDEPTAGVDVELRKDMWQMVRDAARLRRHHHPDHALHRRSRGDGRPHRRHQQGRDHPGRGQGRADAQARQEAADAAAAEAARRRAGRRSPRYRLDAGRRRHASWSTPTTPRASAPASPRCSTTSATPASASSDLQTTQSSLEDIFVGLVRQATMNLRAVRAIYRSRWRAPGARCCRASSRR